MFRARVQGCRFFVLLLGVLAVACASSGKVGRAGVDGRGPSALGPTEHAFARLRAKGVSEEFLQVIAANYREDERARVLDLNLLGFLKTRPPAQEVIPNWEIDRVNRFVKQYKQTFHSVEKKFPVPRQVIASLLWVETKHGRDLGTFHTASAFFSLAMADYPTILDQTLEVAKSRAKDFTKEIEQRVIARSTAKADWAAGELLALQELHGKNYKDAVTLKGSFAGAFGMAQFLPSSYLSWAKGKKQTANLFRPEDSIYSVANYLSSNGWKRRDRESQEGALFHYNRDRNYVNRILTMSECAREQQQHPKKPKAKGKRAVASTSNCRVQLL